jgi:hypothetical protein
MSPNRFDQASRYAAKLDAVGFLGWLLREDAAELRFRLWLDTRTLPFPGDVVWPWCLPRRPNDRRCGKTL